MTRQDQEYIRQAKNYCQEQLQDYRNYGGSVNNAIDRSFGVVMFTLNYLLSTYDNDFADWWSDIMKPEFNKI